MQSEEPGYVSTEVLYREHRPFVARFLSRLGVRPEALDDAVQEVFVTVHRRGGYVQGPAKPTSYLATIAVNTAAAQRRTARKLAERTGHREPDELATRALDPAATLETRQELHRLDHALSHLEPSLRDTLLRADGEGETCVAIADATEVPLGTVYWRLDRARKKLREAWRKVDAPRRVGMFVALFTGERARASGRGWTAKLALGSLASAIVASVMFHHARPAREHAVTPPKLAAPLRAAEPVAEVPRPVTVEERTMVYAPAPPPSREQAAPRSALKPAARPTMKPAAKAAVSPVMAIAAKVAPPRESEVAQLARAEALLARDPRAALALVRTVDAREDKNYLREERDYIELMALLASGERAQGRDAASAFLQRYPDSAFARVVQARAGAR